MPGDAGGGTPALLLRKAGGAAGGGPAGGAGGAGLCRGGQRGGKDHPVPLHPGPAARLPGVRPGGRLRRVIPGFFFFFDNIIV